MEKQYAEAKAAYPDAIMMIRVGDFFELFGEDAVVASKVLGITLTSRDKRKEDPLPMAGVPHHAVDAYIARLVADGYRVALCDQLEDPAQAKGVVKRGVTQVVTPGVVLEGDALEQTERRLLGVLAVGDKVSAAGWVDFSTGEARIQVFATTEEALAWLGRSDVFEWVAADAEAWTALTQAFGEKRVIQAENTRQSKQDLQAFLQEGTRPELLDSLSQPVARKAFLAACRYISYIQLGQKPRLRVHDSHKAEVVLDSDTVHNLEVFATGIEKRREGSLFHVLSGTSTVAGRRQMAEMLRVLLQDTRQIQDRQSRVSVLHADPELCGTLQAQLQGTVDCVRLAMRLLHGGRVRGPDLSGLRETLAAWWEIQALLGTMPEFKPLLAQVPDQSSLQALLQKALVDEPALSPAKGPVLASTYDAELGALRDVRDNSQAMLAQFEADLQQQYDLPNAKVRQNRVFGYYIELPRSQSDQAPDTFIRKQTLANAERFETPELHELGTRILHAQADALSREQMLLEALLGEVAGFAADIISLGECLAWIDCAATLATIAAREAWQCPQVDASCASDTIKDGRHPALSLSLGSAFVPNDTCFEPAHRFHLLTGPNMGGKSTYMKQIGQLYLLAQVGSFVPASHMHIRPVDQIFTRVGAGDDIARGDSTFMVEMKQCAHIVDKATEHSLVLLDEVGRGTSTFDGLSIAWALVRHLLASCGPRAVFATHYHELAELEQLSSGIRTYAMDVTEWNDSIVFKHKVRTGSVSHSYGIHVAALAGLPEELVTAAREKLAELEWQQEDVRDRAPTPIPGTPVETPADQPAPQQSLFASPVNDFLRQLASQNVLEVSPIESLKQLEAYRATALRLLGLQER